MPVPVRRRPTTFPRAVRGWSLDKLVLALGGAIVATLVGAVVLRVGIGDTPAGHEWARMITLANRANAQLAGLPNAIPGGAETLPRALTMVDALGGPVLNAWGTPIRVTVVPGRPDPTITVTETGLTRDHCLGLVRRAADASFVLQATANGVPVPRGSWARSWQNKRTVEPLCYGGNATVAVTFARRPQGGYPLPQGLPNG